MVNRDTAVPKERLVCVCSLNVFDQGVLKVAMGEGQFSNPTKGAGEEKEKKTEICSHFNDTNCISTVYSIAIKTLN